jgi:tetratricopeptide (TPR) repeat protein
MLTVPLLLTTLMQPPAPPGEADRLAREARTRFGLAMLQRRQDRLLEAVQLLEEAVRLDPSAAAPRKSLIPLYLTLGRTADAVALARQVVERFPADGDTWNILAEVLRDQGEPAEAVAALRHAVDSPALAERPVNHLDLLLKLGRWCDDAHDWAGAEAAYRRAAGLATDGRDRLLRAGSFTRAELAAEAAHALEEVGRACLNGRRFAEAVGAFRQAQAVSRGDDPARALRLNWNLAEVFAAQGRPTDALAILDPYLDSRPPNPAAYELKVRLLREAGRPGEVVPSLRRSVQREPDLPALRLILARELAAAGDDRSAQAEFRSLAKLAPTEEVYRVWFRSLRGNPGAVLELLDEALKQASGRDGQPETDAVAAAERGRAMLAALRGEPELVRGLLALAAQGGDGRKDRSPEALWALADLAARTNQLDDAERFYRLALHRVPPQDLQLQGDLYAGLLPVLWKARQRTAVRELAAEGLQAPFAPAPLLRHYYLALAQDELGESEEALRTVERALSLPGGGDRLAFRCLRVTVLRRAGQFDAATAACEALLKEFHEPQQVRDIRAELAQVYEGRRDFARAEEQLQLILAADPNDAVALNSLGYHWADRGCRLDEAERLIRKAIDLDRAQRRHLTGTDADSAAYLDSLGWVLFRRGQAGEGRRWLEQAAALPDGSADPTVWDHLGDVYYRLGEAAKARSAWESARRLYATERRPAGDDRPAEVERKLKTVLGP